MLQQRITTVDQQNWVAKLLGYHFEVIYKPGPENKAVDSLSRQVEEIELNSLKSFPIWLQSQQVQQEVTEDEQLKQVREDLLKDPNSQEGFSLQ